MWTAECWAGSTVENLAAQMVVSLADPTVEMMVSYWAEKTVDNLADEKADHLVGKWVVEMVGQTE